MALVDRQVGGLHVCRHRAARGLEPEGRTPPRRRRRQAGRARSPVVPCESVRGARETRFGARHSRSPGPDTEKARICGPFSKRLKGLEPSTFCMASRRSSQLSYSRTRAEYSHRGSWSRAIVRSGGPGSRPRAPAPITRRDVLHDPAPSRPGPRRRLPARSGRARRRVPPRRGARPGRRQPGRPPRRPPRRPRGVRPGHALLDHGAARHGRARRLARPQRPRHELGHVPLREVGAARGVAARREPRGRLAPRRPRPRRPRRGPRPDRPAARAGPHRPPARPRAPHGRRGDHLGLQLLGRRDGRVQALLGLLQQARRAPQARRPDRRPPRPPAHRDVEGGRGQADVVLGRGAAARPSRPASPSPGRRRRTASRARGSRPRARGARAGR